MDFLYVIGIQWNQFIDWHIIFGQKCCFNPELLFRDNLLFEFIFLTTFLLLLFLMTEDHDRIFTFVHNGECGRSKDRKDP